MIIFILVVQTFAGSFLKYTCKNESGELRCGSVKRVWCSEIDFAASHYCLCDSRCFDFRGYFVKVYI